MVTSSSTLRPSHFLRPLHVLRTYLAIVGRILADRFTFHTTVEPRPLPVSPLHRVSKVHVGKSRQRPNQGIVAHFSFPSIRFSFDYSASIIDIYPLLEIDFGDRIDDRIESFLTLSSNLSSSSTDLESLPSIIGCKRRNPLLRVQVSLRLERKTEEIIWIRRVYLYKRKEGGNYRGAVIRVPRWV